ncbi:HDIG domain-containing protein [Paenibacillus aurantius]|uniref:HDIG domain-containing protein n=1 Tax=Paenibacillus aurantius TaxID=2918900 RepID=A0AA96LGK5_9BACL|nr:HDIG domain-containing metalloprotein [Paenibacillus aurantius]WNQ13461.1 HDIG domain-containing protein [Paenibacillus aurantius]
MSRNEELKSGKSHYWEAGWKQSAVIRFFLFVSMAMLFYFSTADRLVPKTYDIRPNTISGVTIVAPKQIENSVETQKAKEEAAQRVTPVYRIVPIKNEQLISVLYDKLELAINDQEMKSEEKVSYYRSVFPRVSQDFVDELLSSLARGGQPYNETLLAEIQKQLMEQQYKFPEESYFKLNRLTKEDLAAMEPVTKEIVARLMNDQIVDAQTVRAKVTELVNSSTLTKNTTRELVQEIARFSLTPNKFFDSKGTEEAKAQARENTKTIYTNKNDILLNKGEMVTEALYQRLEKENLLKTQGNVLPPLGLLLFVFLLVLVLYMYIRQSRLPINGNNVQLVMLVIIYVINVLCMRIVALGQNLEYPHVGYLAPAAIGTMLIVILLDVPLAVVSSFLFSILASIIFNADLDRIFDFRFGFVALVMCYTAIFSLHKASQRSTILRAGVLISIFGCVSIISLNLLENHYSNIGFALLFALANGVVTAILVMGLMPFFETVFGILSPLKLVELSNPNLPLLRKLLTETPGTYHHSVMVGNLAEAAAEAIGADGLLSRVGAYYHDIGKTKRPSYFIENQMNMENPHDDIDPGLSTSIITAHPRDGVEMLKEHNVPKAIRDIAEQHHGTTLLKYFYHKAKKQQGDHPTHPIKEEDYRYPGPKAQCKETAIVGIADCVEAAVRSLRHPTIEQIDTMVRKIIKDRLDDGQFDECDLTIKELDTIGKALKETLLGIFHSRIEYPSELPPKNESAGGA